MKKTKTQKGITLIALIITIVVLLILAVVTIRSVQDGGIIQNAKDAQAEHVVAQEKEKITLAVNKAYLDGNGVITKEKLSTALSTQLANDLASIDDTAADFIQIKLKSGREYKVYLKGQIEEVVQDTPGGENPGETPPVDGGDTTVSQAQFDAEFLVWQQNYLAENNNVAPTQFEYGDYEYRLNQYVSEYYPGTVGNWWNSDSTQNGWGVRVKDTTKESYGMVVSNAFGSPVNAWGSTFHSCSSLKKVPNVPDCVTNMKNVFWGCSALKSLPTDFSIPSGVTDVSAMFSGCSQLTSLPTNFSIPSGVTNVYAMFRDCSQLTSLPTNFSIPSGVTNVSDMFNGCSQLTGLPTNFSIPSGVTDVYAMFRDCSQLTSLPTNFSVPNGVTSVSNLFSGCSLLESLPSGFSIPSSVTTMDGLFKDCKLLTNLPNNFEVYSGVISIGDMCSGCEKISGVVIINSNTFPAGSISGPMGYGGCFAGTTEKIEITTTSENVTKDLLDKIAATSTSGNVEVKMPTT